MTAFTTRLTVGASYQKATTQRMNFPMTSMCRFGKNHLCTSEDGLFSLGGDDLAGENIDAYFEPVMTDFGIPNPKRLRHVYIGFESSGELLLTLIADEQAERSYKVSPTKTGQQRIRVPIGRDGFGRYWTFRISNVSGCDFSIDSIEVLPVIRSRGVKGY